MPPISRPDALQAGAARPPRRRLGRQPRATRPIGWPCRRASSTSAARRRPRTSAPRRCCWRSWRSMYAVYHGPEGLRAIARRIHRRDARAGARVLRSAGWSRAPGGRSSTRSRVEVGAERRQEFLQRAPQARHQFPRHSGRRLGRASASVRRDDDARRLSKRSGAPSATTSPGIAAAASIDARNARGIPDALRRTDAIPARIRSSTGIARKPRCCATCAGSPIATSRSTAR